MAIDTKAKRMSMLSFASPLAWQNHFEVDGAVDADDRAHLLHLYGGNALGSPAVTNIRSGCWAKGEVYKLGYKAGEVYHHGFNEGQKVC